LAAETQFQTILTSEEQNRIIKAKKMVVMLETERGDPSKPEIVLGLAFHDATAHCNRVFLEAVEKMDYPKEKLGVVIAESNVRVPIQPIIAFFSKFSYLKVMYTPPLEECIEGKLDAHLIAIETIRKEALKCWNMTHLLSLEIDNPPPPNLLKRLLAINTEETPITCGWYIGRFTGKPFIYVLRDINDPYSGDQNGGVNLVKKGGVVEVDSTGIGCMLIRRKVLEKIPFQRRPNCQAGDDSITCIEYRKAGYKILCDTGVEVPHLFR